MATFCLHRATARELADTIAEGGLTQRLVDAHRELLWQEPSPSEVRSWVNSIPTVVTALLGAGLDGVTVLLEMKTPITDVRMDMVLIGTSPASGRMSVVVVENKQWSWVQPVPESELVRISRDGKPTLHPANQVWGYRHVLADFVPLLRTATVCGVVNLHNAPTEQVAEIHPDAQGLDPAIPRWVRLLGKDQRKEFQATLQSVLSAERSAEHADDLLEAVVVPTEGLMTKVAEAVRARSVFPLLDEQREAYDYVRALVKRAKRGERGSRKEVVVIVGGPGTGKSVIAVELLGALNRQGTRTMHATGSRSFTQTLRLRAGLPGKARGGFAYFNNFTDAAPNDLDVLIADEAHRIRRTSRDRRSTDDLRIAPPQVDELINAAHVPVFLLDEFQIVRRDELGSVGLIEEAAARAGCSVNRIDLRHQFRCAGSPTYVDWVERLLKLAPTNGKPMWQPTDGFTLQVVHDPAVMETFLRERVAEGHTARIMAGFCWPWSEPSAEDPLPVDVKLPGWERPWNLQAEEPINGIPPWPLWATDSAGFGQIGCIYSAQGFEFDYAGVIIGPDLTWTPSGWVTVRQANKDRTNTAPETSMHWFAIRIGSWPRAECAA
ncbi:ATP-binding protein [Sphaerisporangium krabiense]|uniref:AAA+ ATPase domain-containing protein n=1 Tax=Sphaerisporangium krabiense TaxID=763782 RepID=A0A7W8Z6P1_9ACTN|nr:DNA/RNA helicase domain-containing protein [Sphaerisporangium krabiense]MBB5628469.1 hypothetical protein [Sphaerisporangium krabiense]GII67111.1 ATP-binding protein [Sphaerisporangium krabiense]